MNLIRKQSEMIISEITKEAGEIVSKQASLVKGRKKEGSYALIEAELAFNLLSYRMKAGWGGRKGGINPSIQFLYFFDIRRSLIYSLMKL